ncbi:CAAX protease self-immunity [Rhodococcus tukisamuensis]|uniref:CAAX protease self-immunity n=1 Tax=Rhodococcus tukisamuensis TaxID=168276 RepID=A0A1G6M6V3_9NOCA|nr:CAAX protease self-immunity [Rhodococcus tukisamuensis]
MARVTRLDEWLRPNAPAPSEPAPTPEQRRALWFEITVVLLVTFGLSGLSGILSLTEDALAPGVLSDQTVALNVTQSTVGWIDLGRQLLGIAKLCAWAALGLYLLWRSGLGPARIGLPARPDWRRDLLPGVGLAALIGLPGLALYLVANALGANLTVVPSTIDDHWWRLPALVAWAFANSAAEEVLVVAYLISRLRRLGWSENRSLLASAVLRGSYHLYQGLGGGLGNVVMGLVFGRYWQKTGRLWPLVVAHWLIDAVAFVGYTALRGHVSWLP